VSGEFPPDPDAVEVAALAKAQGLQLSVDKWDWYYLHLPRAEVERRYGVNTMNPGAVLFRALIEEVDHYLRTHIGEHETLGPGAVIRKIRGEGWLCNCEDDSETN
jgi:hypothetical protein